MNSQVVKALIINTVTGERVPVLYNPEELRLEQGNTFAEVGIPGLNQSPIQYVRGKPRILSMDLFFDTYESQSREDVRIHTGKVLRLLDKDPRLQAPPILLFSMGAFQFQCVLVEVGQRFTMFARDGTPVRATLSVRLQEYVRIDLRPEQGVFLGPPTVQRLANVVVRAASRVVSRYSSVHMVTRGDTLSGLAGAYLGDPGAWRAIAEANDIDDPLNLVPGASLVIPTDAPNRRGKGAGG